MAEEGEVTTQESGNVLIVTMSRASKLNSLTPKMMQELEAVALELERNDRYRAMVLTGAGERAFTAGADLASTIPNVTSGRLKKSFRDPEKRFFSDVTKPIIAAVNGLATAGGVEILLGTDIRVCVPDATFALGEVRWGLVPAGGSHVRLSRNVPWAIAMEILLTGAPIDAERAYQVGLVNRIVDRDSLMEAAMQYAEAIGRNGPLAVRTAKEIAVAALELSTPFRLEAAMAERVFRSDDAKEGPRSFIERRPPEFHGR